MRSHIFWPHVAKISKHRPTKKTKHNRICSWINMKNLKRTVTNSHGVSNRNSLGLHTLFFKAQGWSHMSSCQANRSSRMLHPHSRLWVRQEMKSSEKSKENSVFQSDHCLIAACNETS
jgi:hypothetical protein